MNATIYAYSDNGVSVAMKRPHHDLVWYMNVTEASLRRLSYIVYTRESGVSVIPWLNGTLGWTAKLTSSMSKGE